MERLYQAHPRINSTYKPKDKNGNEVLPRSFTDSLESYRNAARKELAIIRKNERLPSIEIVWHLLRVFSAEEIKALRMKVFRSLKESGVEAIANIELTRDKYGNPNNAVHFHILTDAPRSIEELRGLLERICKRNGLIKEEDYRITCRELYNPYGYIDYFTKAGHPEKVILFQKGMRMQKFYGIGKWFRKPKKRLWEEIKEYMRRKNGTDIDTDDSGLQEELNDTPATPQEGPSRGVMGETNDILGRIFDLIDNHPEEDFSEPYERLKACADSLLAGNRRRNKRPASNPSPSNKLPRKLQAKVNTLADLILDLGERRWPYESDFVYVHEWITTCLSNLVDEEKPQQQDKPSKRGGFRVSFEVRIVPEMLQNKSGLNMSIDEYISKIVDKIGIDVTVTNVLHNSNPDQSSRDSMGLSRSILFD